jgi:hydroxymethylglutaryl-CoA lyase
VILATSVGVETPGEVAGLCSAVRERWPGLDLGLHLHNLNGMALASAWAASRVGVTRFEGTLCGIGGGIVMPPGVEGYGNIALEDLAAMFIGDGHRVGTSLPRIVAAARAAAELLGLDRSSGHASGGWTRDEVLATSGAGERTLSATGRS